MAPNKSDPFNRELFVARVQKRYEELRIEYASGGLSPADTQKMAVLAFERDDPDTAIPLLQEVLSVDPKNQVAKVWLICAMVYSPSVWLQYDKIISLADAVVRESSGEIAGAALYFKACAMLNSGNGAVDEAISALKDSVVHAPNWVGNHSELANKLERSGKYEAALEHYRRALENMSHVRPEWSLYERLWETHVACRLVTSYGKRDVINRIKELETHTGT